ncbi:MAG: hypothetical protein IJY43_00345 [Clostridia bacterium]|nr:hypothetical protein [Clostridia bacterium]
MKTFVRLLTLLLALLMLAMTVVACDDGNKDGDDVDRKATEDEFLRERDDLDRYNLNYTGEKITVIGWDGGNYEEFDVKQITADNVLMAVYDRNQEIERRLNIDLEFIEIPRDNVIRSVVSDKNSGMGAYDIIATYSRTEAEIAMRGCMADISTIENSYINLEKPWWPKNMVESMSIGNSMYFFSGDISPNVLSEMQVLYFNKDVMSEYWDAHAQKLGVTPEKDSKGQNVVSPAAQWVYNMAYEGTWDLDELIKLTMGPDGKGIGDISQGSVADAKDLDDSYGFVSISYCLSFFYSGCNLKLIENDKNSTDENPLNISEDFGSMRTVKLVQKLGDWYKENTCAVNFGKNYRTIMQGGRTLFTAVRARHAGNEYVDLNIGIMPCPKFDDETQANYYTAIGNPFTIYGIYNGLTARGGDKQATYSMMTAVVECWASECYRLVTPQIFEVNMQLKYAETQCETDMFEIVRSSVVFDLGRIFGPELYGMDDMPSEAAKAGTSWVSTYASYKNPLAKKLDAIVASLEE